MRGRGAVGSAGGGEGDRHEGRGGEGETPEQVVNPTVVAEEAGALLSQLPPTVSHR